MRNQFRTSECIRNGLSEIYRGRGTNWITGCSVQESGASGFGMLRKCTFCSGPEGIVLLLSCLVRVGGCVLAGTRIGMADGSTKRIEEVEVGDLVQGCAIETERVTEAAVARVARHGPDEMGDYYLRLNGELCVTPYHPMYANDEWIPAGGLMEGDVLLTAAGEKAIQSIEVVYDRAPVFDLVLDGPIAYLAEGVVVPTKVGFASFFRGIESRVRSGSVHTTRPPR